MTDSYPLFADKYELLQRIAVGGMGEIYLARQKGIEGFEKSVVVKRILRRFATQPSFVGMFLDEARVASDLRHPNVVTFFEVGQAEGTYYIAMEYVDGWNLGEVMGRTIKQGRTMPLDCILQIIHDVAGGLHYAHTKHDVNGNPLNIVHRDVTLRNIVVSKTGVAKILDFGLAKATCQTELTLPGKLKGTPSYFAPEQIEGKPASPQTDVFSLGTLLFELTTQRRLFRRGSTVETMTAVMKCQIPPPTSFIDDYPPELEYVVLKALQRNPKDRFLTADDLQLALEKVMGSMSPHPSQSRLGRFVRDLIRDYEILMTSMSDSTDGSHDDLEKATTQVSAPSWLSKIDASTMSEQKTNVLEHKNKYIDGTETLDRIEKSFESNQAVTLVGMAGIGKSRAATEFARKAFQSYAEGGAWRLELENAQSIAEICDSVISGLSLQIPSGDPVSAIGTALSLRGKTLLILDNFEHVARFANDTVVQWMDQAPDTKFLVTSRQAMGISGETTVLIEPLVLPRTVNSVPESPAVQLFAERASTASPEFALTSGTYPTVMRIVKKLDGIPLAIELAAARIAHMSPETLLKNLSRRFDVLRTPSGNGGTKRKNTLRGAIDWSWDLLTPWERTALAQCSVFRAGFDPEAVVAVIDLTEYEEAPGALDVLETLRAKSLVATLEPDGFRGELRYLLYQSICEYARSKLLNTGDRSAVRKRHAQYYLEHGARWYRTSGDKRREARARTGMEMGNLVAIHQRSIGAKNPSEEHAANAMRAAMFLFPVLSIRGPYSSYLRLMDGALAHPKADLVDPEIRMELLICRGHVRRVRGMTAQGRRDLEAALKLAKALEDSSAIGRALTEIGVTSITEGQFQHAHNHLQKSLELHKENGDLEWQARTLNALGNAQLSQGNSQQAKACFEKALPLYKTLGELVLAGACRCNYATLLQALGQLDEAKKNLLEALTIHRQAGARRYEGCTLACLGSVTHEQGHHEEARTLYIEALDVFTEVGNRRWEAVATAYMGLWCLESGDLNESARLLRKAEAILSEVGDARTRGIVQCILGAAEALRGNTDLAARALKGAGNIALKLNDSLLVVTVEASRGFLDLTFAAMAAKQEDTDAHKDNAASRVNRVVNALAPSPEDNARTADLSDVLRILFRILKAHIQVT